jgi:hypothetical protein
MILFFCLFYSYRNKSLSLNRRLSQTNRTNEVIVELTVTNNVDKCLGVSE